LPQRWYWSIVVQVRDVIRQFTQGTPNCNTNPKSNRLWYSKRTRIGIRRTNHQPIDRSGLTPASRLRRSMGQSGHATGTPDSTFPGTGRRTHGKHAGQTQNQS
ncbi:hypothetical protein TNCV_2933451, partial [Trichonephila clavipes]